MREINTKFGKLYIDALADDRHTGRDESKIKLYDSREQYMDYFETETFYELAEMNDNTPEEELNNYIKCLESYDTIESLVENTATSGYEFFTQSWKEVATYLGIALKDEARALQDVVNNEWVNQIGDYYIVVSE